MSEAEQVPRRRRRGHRAAGPPTVSSPPGEGPAIPPESPAPVSATPGSNAPAAKQPRAEGRKPRTKKSAAAAQSPPVPAGQPPGGGKTRSAQPHRKDGRSGEQGHGPGERGWRDLAGSAPSLVGVSGALRARDVARPGPDELAAAERELVIVRRQWQPPAGEPGIL